MAAGSVTNRVCYEDHKQYLKYGKQTGGQDLNNSSRDYFQKSKMTKAGPSGEEVEFHVLWD